MFTCLHVMCIVRVDKLEAGMKTDNSFRGKMREKQNIRCLKKKICVLGDKGKRYGDLHSISLVSRTLLVWALSFCLFFSFSFFFCDNLGKLIRGNTDMFGVYVLLCGPADLALNSCSS